MPEGTPAGIDRPALERILQRAAELQAGERDIGHALSPEEVLALGREVGIPDRYLQQALLEERVRVDAGAPGVWERIAGPATVVAQRGGSGSVELTERSLLGWMEQNELLCVQRQQPGRIVWEPVGGIAAAVRRSTAAIRSGRPFMLSRADTVLATILPLGPGRSHVALSAVTRRTRAEFVGGGAAMAAPGWPVGSARAPWSALARCARCDSGRHHRRVRHRPSVPWGAERIQLGLERALDYLEQGATRPEHQIPGGARDSSAYWPRRY